jgi:hypothetical protein
MSESRMEGKIDAIKQDVHEIKVILAVNTASLETHIKRILLVQSAGNGFSDKRADPPWSPTSWSLVSAK